jgi:hypothetical protein
MGVLGNTGLTSAQLLIDGLIAGFGEVNKTLVGTAALGVNESVTKALESLRTLGTSLITDLVAGALKKLNDDKLVLVAKAKEIADAIAEAMAGAAAGIGVIVDGASGDIAELNKQIAATKAASDSLTGGDGKKTEDKKTVTTNTKVKTGSAPVYGGAYADMYKAGINPNIKIPSLSKVVGTTATVKMPTPILKPTASASAPRGNTSQPSSSGNPYSYGRVMAGAKPPVTVNITTQKVVPTVTSTTISNAIDKARNGRRG